MQFTVVKITQVPSGAARSVQAVSENQIAISFSEPVDMQLALLQVLEVDLEAVGQDQSVMNETTGEATVLKIPRRDVHDLRLPARHGASRYPTLRRRRGD
jgi:hypothetical protein